MPTILEEKIKNAQILVPVQELTGIFRELIREEINAKNEKELQEKLLSPEETCNLFSPAISKPTLESYAQKELIKKYWLGGRTWFKYSEVIEAVKEIKRFSRNN